MCLLTLKLGYNFHLISAHAPLSRADVSHRYCIPPRNSKYKHLNTPEEFQAQNTQLLTNYSVSMTMTPQSTWVQFCRCLKISRQFGIDCGPENAEIFQLSYWQIVHVRLWRKIMRQGAIWCNGSFQKTSIPPPKRKSLHIIKNNFFLPSPSSLGGISSLGATPPGWSMIYESLWKKQLAGHKVRDVIGNLIILTPPPLPIFSKVSTVPILNLILLKHFCQLVDQNVFVIFVH